MKKILFICFTVAAMASAGCDPSGSLRYEVNNGTQSDVILQIGEHEPVTIPPGSQKMAYSESGLGGVYSKGYVGPRVLKVTINDKTASDDFWLREYWEEKREGRYNYNYTMILTDELIETLLTE